MSIYLIMIIIYFAVLLAMGVIMSKRVKDEKDYFIAKDKLSAPVIGFSYSATQMSGSTYMSTAGQITVLGYAFIPSALTSAAAPWFSFIIAGDRVRKVANKISSITLADIFEARYGKKAGLAVAIVTFIAVIPLITAQLRAGAVAFGVTMNIPYMTGLFVFGSFVVLYTFLGGMFAVAWSDLIQGVLMTIGLLILVPVVLSQAGGFTNAHAEFARMNPAGMSMTGTRPALWVISAFFMWGFFQIGGAPSALTRFLMTSDEKKLNSALVYSITFQSFIFLFVALLGIAGGTLIRGLANPDELMAQLILTYLHPVIGGVVLAAALAAMMSTVDSVLLLASSIFVNNIYVKGMGKPAKDAAGLRLGRILTIIIGFVGLLFAINPPDAVLWIIAIGFQLMAAAFTFPFIFGLWWPGTTKIGGIAGIISGFVVCVVWYVWSFVSFGNLSVFIGGIWPGVIGALVSLVVTIVASLGTPPIDKETAEIFYAD